MNGSERVNPFLPPNAEVAVEGTRQVRRVSWQTVALAGAVIGLLSHTATLSALPHEFLERHGRGWTFMFQLILSFPLLIGCWAAWLRRRWSIAALGPISGMALLIFLAVESPVSPFFHTTFHWMVTYFIFPALVGGCLSSLLGVQRDGLLSGWFRFGKGMLAGVSLGSLFWLVINCYTALVKAELLPLFYGRTGYMWHAGTPAMIAAACVFLLIFHWAANLGR